jgi:DNA-binding XRE family transcriptional regulator
MYYVFVLKAQYGAKGDENMAISIKAARVNSGYTQIEVAKSVGKSKNTIASYEAYTTNPDILTAQKMAALFNMSVDDISWAKE